MAYDEPGQGYYKGSGLLIEIRNISKNFGSIKALNEVSFSISSNIVFGLLGTNGAGKSTLLRVMSGIIEADAGEVSSEGDYKSGSMEYKRNFFYLSDEPYYFPGATMESMAKFYRNHYPDMDMEGLCYMAEKLELHIKQPVRTFSKGMKRQAFLIMALCANTRYLLCDEVFDGLDPVVTEIMKNLFQREMEERDLTIVIAAHKLQDLEGFCHNIGILHKGGIVMAGDMRKRAGNILKMQCVFREDEEKYLKNNLEILRYKREENFTTLIVNGDREKTIRQIEERRPLFYGEVPVTLEELFIAEMEGTGYDISKVLQQLV